MFLSRGMSCIRWILYTCIDLISKYGYCVLVVKHTHEDVCVLMRMLVCVCVCVPGSADVYIHVPARDAGPACS